MDLQPVIDELAEAGLLDASRVNARALTGGVSSDIWLLDDGTNRWVIKRALAELRVAAEWKADPGRNASEYRFLQYVGDWMPEAVPAVRYVSPTNHFFAMDYLAGNFRPWKQDLLDGKCDPNKATLIGKLLGRIHAKTWECDEVRAVFDTTPWFDQLRLDPYLRATGASHPQLQTLFNAEADRIAAARLCLVHGDYSPKNLLVESGRAVVVDCETAWYGDPTFDAAFLLNHLMLKALHLPDHRAAMLRLARTSWNAYATALGSDHADVVEKNLPRLLLMLMLARMDGKSPVEYLGNVARDRVRAFVTTALPEAPIQIELLLNAWSQALDQP